MQEIVRQLFAQHFPKTVSATAVRRSLSLAPYREEPSPSSIFSVYQLLAVAIAALNEHVVTVFLKKDAGFALRTIKAIVEDHLREPGHVPKDLQVNLLANLIVQFTHAQVQQTARWYQTAEDMVRECDLDDIFKLQIKTALFDRQSVLCKNLMVHPYRPLSEAA